MLNVPQDDLSSGISFVDNHPPQAYSWKFSQGFYLFFVSMLVRLTVHSDTNEDKKMKKEENIDIPRSDSCSSWLYWASHYSHWGNHWSGWMDWTFLNGHTTQHRKVINLLAIILSYSEKMQWWHSYNLFLFSHVLPQPPRSCPCRWRPEQDRQEERSHHHSTVLIWRSAKRKIEIT